ncbi:hypothetical protein BDQ17DRAFT_115971 [Cyathus striatus]|nr:hypothetical protein BDQ17DRAFT_115971 [Cyathus striatus]
MIRWSTHSLAPVTTYPASTAPVAHILYSLNNPRRPRYFDNTECQVALGSRMSKLVSHAELRQQQSFETYKSREERSSKRWVLYDTSFTPYARRSHPITPPRPGTSSWILNMCHPSVVCNVYTVPVICALRLNAFSFIANVPILFPSGLPTPYALPRDPRKLEWGMNRGSPPRAKCKPTLYS